MCLLQDAQAQGQLVNGTLKAAGTVQKAVDTDIANQASEVGKQQAVVDSAIKNDVHGQQDVLNKTAIAVGKQQAVADKAIASNLDKQQKVLNKTVTVVGSVSPDPWTLPAECKWQL